MSLEDYFSFIDNVIVKVATGSSPKLSGTVAITGTEILTLSPVLIVSSTAAEIALASLQI